MLRDNGFRLVSLDELTAQPDGHSPLENAGLGGTRAPVQRRRPAAAFEPSRDVYDYVCRELQVAPADCMMVAAHVWDTIGAQSAGFSGH